VEVKPISDLPTGPVPDLDDTEIRPRKKSLEPAILEPNQSPSPKKKLKLLKPPRLTVTTEPDKGFHAEFDLVDDSLTFGRAKDNALHIPLAIISRHHAVITRLDSKTQLPSYKIVQCNSINSLRYQGQRIAEKILEDGDIIEIGDRNFAEYIVKLTYHAPESG
jgi:pSer/pThr/pTyr-binding forkhead associated (FHA) protein